MSYTNDFNDSILSKKRLGNANDPYKVISETISVINGKAILTEIPNRFEKVSVSGAGTTMYEVEDGELTDSFYKVDYVEGVVFFNSTHNNKSITFSYLGEGRHFFPSSGVWVTKNNQNEIQTAKEKFDDLDIGLFEPKSRVDNLILGNPQPDEIMDIRVDKNGVTYNIAKDRIDAEQMKIESAYVGKDGKNYTSLKDRFDKTDDRVGDLSILQTTAKTSLVQSLNEQFTKMVNDKTELTNKSNLNGIINRSKMEYISLLNGQNDWVKGTWRPATLDGDWTFGENSIKPTFTTLSTGGVTILHKNKFIQDGEIGVTIKEYDINATTNSGAGIIFKGKNTGDYVVAMILFNLKQVWVGTLKNGVYQSVRTVDVSAGQIVPANGESINLSVKTFGNVFSVFFNGSEVIKEQISSYVNPQDSKGLWGLFIYNASTNVDTFIKNIVFSNLYTKEYDYSVLPNNIDRILYCGDSLTFGAGVTTEERWSTLLTDELVKTYPNLISNNIAVSGSPMSTILDQVKSAIAGEDVVTILGGTNNSRIDDVGTTIDVAISELKQAIQLAKAVGAVPIVGTCPPMDRTKNTVSMNSSSWAWITEYNNQVRRLCAIEKVICVDFYNDFNNDLTLLQSDKLHPTATGHQLMFDSIYRTITGKIKTL
jgi:lysophospholipase L1-like esterase